VAFADSLQQQIRTADAATVIGWVVDLRGNGGGNMWPRVAGVGPVLGEGVAGYFVPPTGAPVAWSYMGGGSFNDGVLVTQTSTSYEPIRRGAKVAVLTDSLVASSGEAVVVSFRGRPNTRSFRGATCGLSTANSTLRLSDGATLFLTTALMADRNRVGNGDSIPPDEPMSGDADVVQRAIAWIRSG
jgi:carboxyl-terminal processing protease